MKIALVIIDMQKCFLSEYQDPAPIAECCEYINFVARMLRAAGHPVIHVQDMEEAGQIPDSELEFTEKIEVEANDLRVQKTRSNAFWNTELQNVVQQNAIDLLVLCGQAAEHCVVFTYNGARERDIEAVILQHGVLSQRPGRVEALMQDRNVISYPVIQAIAAG